MLSSQQISESISSFVQSSPFTSIDDEYQTMQLIVVVRPRILPVLPFAAHIDHLYTLLTLGIFIRPIAFVRRRISNVGCRRIDCRGNSCRRNWIAQPTGKKNSSFCFYLHQLLSPLMFSLNEPMLCPTSDRPERNRCITGIVQTEDADRDAAKTENFDQNSTGNALNFAHHERLTRCLLTPLASCTNESDGEQIDRWICPIYKNDLLVFIFCFGHFNILTDRNPHCR